ncbi:MAG: hypothetical protein QM770_13440 [Tepidisphaeraceae bacterium]
MAGRLLNRHRPAHGKWPLLAASGQWVYLSVLLANLVCCAIVSALPIRVDLGGGGWRLQQLDRHIDIAATVPGCVHTDLLAAKLIEGPFVGTNAGKLGWIDDCTWNYVRSIDVTKELLAQRRVLLHCEGLDTIAAITLNGQEVGSTDNMFRTYEFDVKPLLRPGRNELRVTFSPLQGYVNTFIHEAKGPNSSAKGIANVRRTAYLNGWDFAPKFPTFGIEKSIDLIGVDQGRIDSMAIDTTVRRDSAALSVKTAVDATSPSALKAKVSVSLRGKVVGEATNSIAETTVVTVRDPELWWPNGLGSQPLYDVDVELLNVDGQVVDQTRRRVGLRTIELLPKTPDRPLRLRVNGVDIFARGANWVPSDAFPSRVTAGRLRQLVADAKAANMNMLRCWGGGYYEEDAFFNACDEAGILIWFEFKFANNLYPAGNSKFVDNVKHEVTDQVTRVRHHPSIAVWSGNNEVMGFVTGFKVLSQQDYNAFYHGVIGKTLLALKPDANYVGGSPEAGDEHNWWVWHIGAEFEKYRESHGWMTEFGFQSFPCPTTVHTYAAPGDDDLLKSPVHLAHQLNGNGRGNAIILDQMARYFRPAKDFESTLWLSQINQAYGMLVGIEHWRSDGPASSGALVWQYNDTWPGASWSAIDYFGRWKALQYRLRSACAPVMVCAIAHEKLDDLQVKIASDLSVRTNAQLRWTLLNTAGERLDSGEQAIDLPAGTASTAGPTLVFTGVAGKVDRERLLLSLVVESAGQRLSDRVVTLVRPKDLQLQEPGLSAQVAKRVDGYDVTLRCQRPALWVWLDCADADARYSDNFIDLLPREPHTIHVRPRSPIDEASFRSSLRIRSLFDTYESTTK